VSFTD
jgi:hypothetical protein